MLYVSVLLSDPVWSNKSTSTHNSGVLTGQGLPTVVFQLLIHIYSIYLHNCLNSVSGRNQLILSLIFT